MAAGLARRHMAHAVTAVTAGTMCRLAAGTMCRLTRSAAIQCWYFLVNYLKCDFFYNTLGQMIFYVKKLNDG
jgi:hypothetical protein